MRASLSHITLQVRGGFSPIMRSKTFGIPNVDDISRQTPPSEMLRMTHVTTWVPRSTFPDLSIRMRGYRRRSSMIHFHAWHSRRLDIQENLSGPFQLQLSH